MRGPAAQAESASGTAPYDRRVVPLRRVAEIVMGQSPPSADYNADGTGPPFLQGNADFGERHPRPRVYCATATKHAKVGDVLLSVRAPVGALNMADQEYGLGRGLCAIRGRPGVLHTPFLRYALEASRAQLQARSAGSTYDAVTSYDVGDWSIPLPPVSMQRTIAKSLDERIATLKIVASDNATRVRLLWEQRRGEVMRAVSLGYSVAEALKPSGLPWLEHIPSRWEAVRLRLLARLESGHTPSRSHPEYWKEEECVVPWFTLSDVWQLRDGRQEYLGDTEECVSERGLANSAARRLPAGTVVLSRTASVGFSGIMPREMATTQDFANWVCGDRLVPEYLLYVLRAMKYKGEFERLTSGSTHQTIYMPAIRKLAIPVPPVSEQHQIVDRLRRRLDPIDRAIDAATAQGEKLLEYRSSLISAAVLGRLDAKTPAAVAP